LSKEPLRFKPRDKKNKSKVSLSGTVREHSTALNQNLEVAWRVVSSLNQDGPTAHITKSVVCHKDR